MRFKKDRLGYLEEDYEKKLAAIDGVKNVEPSLVESAPSESVAELLKVASAEKISDSHTKLANTGTGHVADESVLTDNTVASSTGEKNDEVESENDDLNLSEKVQDIKDSDKTLFEKIGELFTLRTQGLRNDLRDDMKSDYASLNLCINNLNGNINDVNSNMNEISCSILDLKSDNEALRRDLEESVHASELKMTKMISSNNKAVMAHVDDLDKRVKKVETAVAAVP